MKWLLLLFLPLAACSKNEQQLVTWQGIFFDIPFELHIAGALSHKQRSDVEKLIHDTFTFVDNHFNHWNPHSEIGVINASSETTFSISDELRTLIFISLKAHRDTNGYFDPSLCQQIMDAKSSLKAGILPQKEHPKVDFSTISVGENLIFRQKCSLDFDGILKGYIVDMLRDHLHERGYDNFLINWSGEIYASGRHPEGRKWKILIPSLQKALELENMALATSGSEAQHWTIENTTYTHIINPKTNRPLEANDGFSITIVGPSCALADAYATALSCTPQEKTILLDYQIYRNNLKNREFDKETPQI